MEGALFGPVWSTRFSAISTQQSHLFFFFLLHIDVANGQTGRRDTRVLCVSICLLSTMDDPDIALDR